MLKKERKGNNIKCTIKSQEVGKESEIKRERAGATNRK